MRHLTLLLLLLLPALSWAQDSIVHTDTAPSQTDTAPSQTELLQKAACGYYFHLQMIEMKVNHDRTMDIEEYLMADYLLESHGFFRTIPKHFWTKRDVSEAQDGSEYEMRYNRVRISDLTVSDEHEVEYLDSLIDIRIGSPNVWLTGPKAYKITYTLQLPEDDRVDAGDLFFHSVIGSGWDCCTDTVYFRIEFEDEIPAESLAKLKVFCGPVEDETNLADEVLYRRDSHHLCGRYYGLQQREAVTLYLPLPDGFFQKGFISHWRRMAQIMAILTLLLTLYLFYREVQGDEPVTPVVTFRPSPGLTSADIGSLVDASVDDIDVLSLIPWMAAEGYIRMTKERDSGRTRIERGSRELPDTVPDYVQSLYTGFFQKGETFYIDKPTREFGDKWLQAKNRISRKYAEHFITNGLQMLLLLLMICLALTCAFACVPPQGAGLFFIILLLLTLEYFFYAHWWPSLTRRVSFRRGFSVGCSSLFVIALITFLIFLGTGTYLTSILIYDDYYLPHSQLLTLSVAVALCVFFGSRLRRLSPLRRQHMGEILGLREFILTAEQSRLQMLLDEDERYFYRILPYAMVFGLVDKWAEKFAALTVVQLDEFGREGATTVKSLVHSSDMNRLAHRSHIVATPTSSTAGRGYSSSGGSYHTSSSHSGGYSGGGSGGGGGRRW